MINSTNIAVEPNHVSDLGINEQIEYISAKSGKTSLPKRIYNKEKIINAVH